MTEDAPYIAKWLALRDQVRAEWKARNEERARAAEEAARKATEADEAEAKEAEEKAKAEGESQPTEKDAALNGRATGPRAADALGRASHALEDFWSHSNFIELVLGIKLRSSARARSRSRSSRRTSTTSCNVDVLRERTRGTRSPTRSAPWPTRSRPRPSS